MLNTNELLELVTILPAVAHRSLAVYPMVANLPSGTTNYLVLDDAIETGHFRITEVSEAGTVPHLLAINETTSPVLLLDGEELVGAKQNRILNLTILLPPRSKTVIPVSCVEAGRWNRESAAFRTVDRVQFARARAQKVAQVSRSLSFENGARSDQLAVWHAIAAKSERMRASSPTGAMATIYESHQADLENYPRAIPISDAQIGAIFAIEGSIVGLELFSAAATYRKLSRKLILSYALDAMEHSANSAIPDLEAAQFFAGSVRTAQSQRFDAAGIGELVRLTSTKVSGAALEFNGACLHLAAFSRTGV